LHFNYNNSIFQLVYDIKDDLVIWKLTRISGKCRRCRAWCIDVETTINLDEIKRFQKVFILKSGEKTDNKETAADFKLIIDLVHDFLKNKIEKNLPPAPAPAPAPMSSALKKAQSKYSKSEKFLLTQARSCFKRAVEKGLPLNEIAKFIAEITQIMNIRISNDEKKE